MHASQVTNGVVAVKILALHDTDGVPVNAIREISLLKELNRIPNVIEYVSNFLILTLFEYQCQRNIELTVWLMGSKVAQFGTMLTLILLPSCRLKEVIYDDSKLYLVFPYVERDLKQVISEHGGAPMDRSRVKVIST